MLKRTLVAGALCGLTAMASAETLYVTDVLRLGIYATQDATDRPFDNLVSGTAVEVLQRVPNYAQVRLGDGRDGWVKSAFLVPEKPAQARVGELEKQFERLSAETAAAKQAQQDAETELARLTHQVESTSGAHEATQASLEQLEAENREYQERFDLYRHSLPWQWVVPAVVVALVGGFVCGLWWLDARIRRRHGGFRVY
jgi:SH3 domain protein